MRTHVSNDGRPQSAERASRTSSLRCRMLGGALLAMVLSEGAQAAYPLQGKWRCTAPAIHVPAHAGVPAGTLHQRTAYAADAEGHWNSNSVIDYVGDRASGAVSARYRVLTAARGMGSVRGGDVLEVVQHYRLLRPFDQSSQFAIAGGPHINALLLQAVSHHGIRRYRLAKLTAQSYRLVPWSAGKTLSGPVIECVRVEGAK